jgi:tetratricopeptide (TPR) repeat protein
MGGTSETKRTKSHIQGLKLLNFAAIFDKCALGTAAAIAFGMNLTNAETPSIPAWIVKALRTEIRELSGRVGERPANVRVAEYLEIPRSAARDGRRRRSSLLLRKDGDGVREFAWQAMFVDLPTAEKLFRTLVERDLGDGNAWKGLGFALVKQGKRDEAIDAFERAAALRPKDIETNCVLAEIAFEALAVEKSVVALRRCLALDPEARHPHGVRARALVKKIEKFCDQLEASTLA